MLRYIVLIEGLIRNADQKRELKRLCTEASTAHVVVPSAPLAGSGRDLGTQPKNGAAPVLSSSGALEARRRLSDGVATLRRLGFAHVDGQVGPAEAYEALTKAVEHYEADAIIVVTDDTRACFTHLDLALHRLLRRIDQPVVVIEARTRVTIHQRHEAHNTSRSASSAPSSVSLPETSDL